MLAVLLMLVACGGEDVKQGKKKKLLGPVNSAPYELLVVCDKDWYGSEGGESFRNFVNTFMPGMPQNEPIFKVICIKSSGFTKTFCAFGSILFVNVGPDYPKEEMITARNMYARPQMVITLNAPTYDGIIHLIEERGDQILDLFDSNEMGRSISLLRKRYSGVVQKNARRMFGCDWHMPEELTQIKLGKNFFWSSSQDNTYNACMYSYPWTSPDTFTKEYFTEKRDSFMRLNIQGEEWGQHMETDVSTLTVKERMLDGHYVYCVYGLWDMKGDAMGGPFVSYVQLDSINKKILVTEGFVYYPNRKKKKMVHALESGLRTLKMNVN